MAKEEVKEVDLFEPVRNYFHSQGYQVQAEVNHCDVVAHKGDALIIIELKLNVNTTLLIQAAKRQRLTRDVYIAIHRPKMSLRRRRWQDLVHLLRRLELGLILVDFAGRKPSVQVVQEPGPFDRKKSMQLSRKKRQSLLREIRNRRSNENIGGSTQVPTITAYREKSIQMALYLDHLGPLSAKKLRELGTGKKTYRILYNNHYKWFQRVERGVYDLTDLGKKEYRLYDEIVKLYLQSKLPE